jgi:peptidoglycan/LPS O-acetylase OafA/YrhL
VEYQTIAQATYYYTFCRMDSLLVGAFLALAAHGPRGIGGLARPALVVGSVIGVLLAGLFAWNRGALLFGDRRVQTAGYTLLALFFGSLLVGAVVAGSRSLWGRLCNHTALRFFGKYSYGIYVFHGFFALPLTDPTYRTALSRYLGPVWLVVLAQVLVGTALSLICALASWHLYEKHFLKLKRFFDYHATTLGEPVRDAVVPPAIRSGGDSPTVGSVEVVPSLVDATGSTVPARRG